MLWLRKTMRCKSLLLLKMMIWEGESIVRMEGCLNLSLVVVSLKGERRLKGWRVEDGLLHVLKCTSGITLYFYLFILNYILEQNP